MSGLGDKRHSEQYLKQERCPRCGARLFDADAECIVEIRCRKCKYLVRRRLERAREIENTMPI